MSDSNTEESSIPNPGETHVTDVKLRIRGKRYIPHSPLDDGPKNWTRKMSKRLYIDLNSTT